MAEPQKKPIANEDEAFNTIAKQSIGGFLGGLAGPIGSLAGQAIATETEAEAREVSPLSDTDRIILNNVFDTNSNARKKYLKRLGWEMSPSDDNKIRPIGSDGDYVTEIDPGTATAFRKGGLKGVARETFRDVKDIAVDVGESAAGAALGAAVSGPAAPVGAAVGAFAGDALVGAMTELGKNAIQEMLLDEDVPIEWSMIALKTALSAVPAMGAGGAKKAGQFVADRMKNIRKSYKLAIQKGLNLSPDVVERIAKNPEGFTKESLEEAGEKFNSTYRSIFGISKEEINSIPPSQIKDGLFGKRMTELSSQQSAILKELDANRQFDVTPEELLVGINQTINDLTAKSALTTTEEANLMALRSFRADVMKVAKDNAIKRKLMPAESTEKASIFDVFKKETGPKIDPITGKEIPPLNPKPPQKKVNLEKIPLTHSQGRELLRRFQDIAFEQRKTTGGDLRKAIGGGDDGMRQVLDNKAANTGLPEVNKKIHTLIKTHEEAASELTSDAILALPKKGTNDSKRKLLVGQLKVLDRELGTKIGDALESEALDIEVKKAFTGRRVTPPEGVTDVIPGVKTPKTIISRAKGISREAEKLEPDAAVKELARLTQAEKDAAAKQAASGFPTGTAAVSSMATTPLTPSAPVQQQAPQQNQGSDVFEDEVPDVFED